MIQNNINDLEKKIKITFNNKQLLIEAFTHKSYVYEQKKLDIINHYERLEFLGDAVIQLIVTDYLYNKYKDKPEGALTKYRDNIINGQNLASVARKLSLGDYILLSKGEIKTKGYNKDNILENVFEALVGAIYIDQGYNTAKDFIKEYLISQFDNIKNISEKDPKTKWQEISQKDYKVTPAYKIILEKGQDHEKIYECITLINKKIVGKGLGTTKKKAETNAALQALERYQKYKGDLEKMELKNIIL